MDRAIELLDQRNHQHQYNLRNNNNGNNAPPVNMENAQPAALDAAGLAALNERFRQMEATVNDVRAQNELLRQAHNAGAAQRPRTAGTKIRSYTHAGDDSDWNTYKRHFGHMILLHHLDEEEAKLTLAANMKGKAAAITADIALEGKSYDQLETAYEDRFLPPQASAAAMVQFENASQRPSEDVLGYHTRLRTLWRRAYPTSVEEHSLIQRFVAGIRKGEVRRAIRRARPANYNDALREALNEDSVFYADRRGEGYGQGDADEPMDINALGRPRRQWNQGGRGAPPAPAADGRGRAFGGGGPGRRPGATAASKDPCHFCDKEGHWKGECPMLQKARRFLAKMRGRGGNPGGRNPGHGGPRRGAGAFRPRGGFLAALEAALEEDEDQDPHLKDALLAALGEEDWDLPAAADSDDGPAAPAAEEEGEEPADF